MTTQRAGSSYYIAAAVLLTAIASFLVLAAMVIRSPQRISTFQWDAPTSATCLPGSNADACFQVAVHNVGNAPGYVQCGVSPAAGTTALFRSSGLPNASGTGGYQPSDTYTSSRPIDGSSGLILLIEVRADKGSRPVAPTVACLSVPAPTLAG